MLQPTITELRHSVDEAKVHTARAAQDRTKKEFGRGNMQAQPASSVGGAAGQPAAPPQSEPGATAQQRSAPCGAPRRRRRIPCLMTSLCLRRRTAGAQAQPKDKLELWLQPHDQVSRNQVKALGHMHVIKATTS